MNGQERISSLFAFIIVDDDGTEGVPALSNGMPLIGADLARVAAFASVRRGGRAGVWQAGDVGAFLGADRPGSDQAARTAPPLIDNIYYVNLSMEDTESG